MEGKLGVSSLRLRVIVEKATFLEPASEPETSTV